ncbi:hypothetical protein FJT64_002767 [Amphibalanus amphitrite]|uniref:Ig-like domain-containing protein n=1 Tax=Amphibalanus amphitrite TaxID=1232801 RepID=A0A6A4WQF8_AMPAM|nr:pollen-specific leucine-rich repeat extensin-like protein 3 [Amphibalanus amphitrite]KAF0304291.1 hypothetical protein FJT64_002767 [Amphibalanus amphitrite]
MISPSVISAVLLVAVLSAGAAAAPASANTSVPTRPRGPVGRAGPPRRTRSCDPAIVLCVETDADAGYSPGYQQPRFYSVGRVPYVPVVPAAPPVPRFRLLPPPVPVRPVPPPPVVAVIPPPPVIPPPADVRVIEPSVRLVPLPPFEPPRAVPVLPQQIVSVIRQPTVSVIRQPTVSVVRQPYVPRTRLFPTYPDTRVQAPSRPDIRSFYQSAVQVGEGVVHLGGRTAELICDFTTNGPYPSSDILTDVVWQRLGNDDVYLNTPMASGSENVLYCPSDYVVPPPVNYDFNVVGTRTSLVIQNSSSRDYGTYRCYATRVNRLNPDDRHPVYMEIQFAANSPRTGLVG